MSAEAYPVPVFHFLVEWGGTRVGFTEVSGFSYSIDPIEYREGNSPDYHVTKMSGMQKFANLTFKRGMFKADNEFWQWISAVALNKPERRTLTVKLLDETHSPIFTWTVYNAFPIKLDGVAFKSTGNEVAVDSIEMVCESWKQEATA